MLTMEHMAMFVVKSINIHNIGQVMDLYRDRLPIQGVSEPWISHYVGSRPQTALW